MNQVVLKGKTVDYELIYRQRKTMEIRLLPPNHIRVISPKGVPKSEIEKVLRKKEAWLLGKLDELAQFEPVTKQMKSGEMFYYLGNQIPMMIHKGNKDHVVFHDDRIEMHIKNEASNHMKQVLINAYSDATMQWIKFFVDKYVDQMTVKPQKIRIKNQRKRWGSCSSKKNLNFNWRLSMMPIEVIEYIVVHEMCHLIHLNHSKDFWQLVEKFLPDYKLRQEWVKKHGYTIMNIIAI
ncbi:M48 family metallopeptidase [Vallitalea okinawensis]|uniref:M48 family metallopeptidase n=1 Tax=Vallitalea okinawensis TaxID=2078660 RepID=UPI000CFC07F7|nr:SprT family zinc-dependent metalloprotease [Vallitalea okinawensis]